MCVKHNTGTNWACLDLLTSLKMTQSRHLNFFCVTVAHIFSICVKFDIKTTRKGGKKEARETALVELCDAVMVKCELKTRSRLQGNASEVECMCVGLWFWTHLVTDRNDNDCCW